MREGECDRECWSQYRVGRIEKDGHKVRRMTGNLQLPGVERLGESQESARDTALGRLSVINAGDHS